MNLISNQKEIEVKLLNKNTENDLNKICSSYLNFNSPKHVEIDGIFYSSLLVINYKREMNEVFLNNLLNLDLDIQISMFYDKKNSYEIIKELTYYIGNTNATIKTSNSNQQDIEILGGTYNDAKYIRKELQMGEEDFFYLNICIGLYSENIEDLERNLEKVESILLANGISCIRANYRQEQALKSILPFINLDQEIEKITQRNVLSSGLVSSYPFISNELYDKNGILFGINHYNQSIILVDRFDDKKYKNANMFILGTSGSGKSFFVKLMINRNRLFNIKQFVIDPDREYGEICKKISGSIIYIGSEKKINIFEIRECFLEKGESYLKNKIQKLKIFINLLLENLTQEENAIIEEILIKTYKEKGITEDNESLYKIDNKSKLLSRKIFKTSEDMPILEDFYNNIAKNKFLKKYTKILKEYVTGSMNYINGITNFDVENKLIVIDIHEILEEKMYLIMYIIMDFLWDYIKKDRNEKKIIYMDEIWKLIYQNRETANFVFKLFKTIRKFGGAATAITQDINDFFLLDEGQYGKGIINNSSIKALFQMEENDIKVLDEVILLTEEERYKLINLERGTTILKAGRNDVMIDVVASNEENNCISVN